MVIKLVESYGLMLNVLKKNKVNFYPKTECLNSQR
jgi:hypothetical protein